MTSLKRSRLSSGYLDPAAGVRTAGALDRARIVTLLARAFADDPAMSYIFPDAADRARRLPRLFGLLFDAEALSGMRLVTPGGEAATLWRVPGKASDGILTLLLHAWPMWRALGGSIGRALAVSNAIAAHFPGEAAWYLHVAGCDPAAQGRGFGAAAVRAGLDRIAGSALPAYLETATEKNLAFYHALGFEITDEWRVPKGGPRFWSMRRAARS
ncbi:GNAT family N-acetyltransferase [Sphingomonas sp. PAMC 26605]|uniref:GNAT family N-acetyltransferase n=1 Tax=Sphingomonas sp. PAMC 26605 TaxID=1112214 RepID=UPI00026CD782|nr:GNAT family N-acetyltransferase [Sphingomonas sp. PAMC 26605]